MHCQLVVKVFPAYIHLFLFLLCWGIHATSAFDRECVCILAYNVHKCVGIGLFSNRLIKTLSFKQNACLNRPLRSVMSMILF